MGQATWAPTVYHDTKPYWDGCLRRQLIIARCADCRTWHHPPNAVCPICWSDNVVHEQASGKATVFSFTVTPAERTAGGQASIQVWAELAEQKDLLFVAEIEGSPPDDIAIDDPLELAWRVVGETPVPVFRKGTR